MRPTLGSLFSGVGGLDCGFERAGFEVKWQVENEPYCVKVLAKHWPDVKRYGDIREVTGEELEWVDCICGGFPCQDISNAGKRAGITGARSGLWSEFARIVRVVRPRFVVVENVAALLGRGMGVVLGDLAACGYDAEWGCVSAASVGAPHLRNRVFIIAYLGDAIRKGAGNQPRANRGQARKSTRTPEPTAVRQTHGASGAGRPEPASADVADATDNWPGWRQQQSQGGEGAGDVANAASQRSNTRGTERAGLIGQAALVGDGGDTGCELLEGREAAEPDHRPEVRRSADWTTLARFCRMVDGFSSMAHGDQP